MAFQVLHEPSEPMHTIPTAGGYDLARVEGVELIGQRILRFLMTVPGELLHRPTWGVGLQKYANKPPTPEILNRMRNDVRGGLRALPFIDGFEFGITHKNARFTLNLRVKIDGAIYVIPEVTF